MVKKSQDWTELTRLTQGERFVVERVRLADRDIAIEGAFEPPALAMLTAEDQVFVAAFLRSHGSIKEMEQVFGVSYPTIKARLTRIAAALPFVDEAPAPPAPRPEPDPVAAALKDALLTRLEKGEISVEDAIKALETPR
jgi:hypothetical protein